MLIAAGGRRPELDWHLTAGLKRELQRHLRTRDRPAARRGALPRLHRRSEEHTSELQSLMRISSAVFCLKNKTPKTQQPIETYLQQTSTTHAQPLLTLHTRILDQRYRSYSHHEQ